ncbi:ABC transporter substrate-binding protein [Streptomyces sp. NBRC 109706]|uniref:ABC transporter substrate-binding protein n=1 Tax=Streptomyces sp. NBRC 109706 TaxID=1550035 RepID=UPI000A9E3DE4|nr:ABC transporter substrate-binding protein [Streptomyces sp. NBRC 109706]
MMGTPARARLHRLSIFPLAALVIAGCGGPATGGGETEDGLTTVRFGSVGGLTDAGLYLADERGYFEEAGIEVTFERMDSGPALTNAIATGQLDAAGISVTPGLYSAFTQNIDMQVVGDKQSLREGFSATRLVARPELVGAGTEESLENLRGRTVAVSATASGAYLLLNDLLEAHGMTLDDIEVTELSYANMSGALSSGAIDGAVMLEPFLAQALDSGDAELVSDLLEVVPPEGITLVPLVYGQDFIDDAETAQNFMNAYVRGVRDYNAAFGQAEVDQDVIELIAERADVPPELVRQASPGGLHPDQLVNVDYLGHLQDFFVEQDLLREPIDVADMVDSSFAEAAVAALEES